MTRRWRPALLAGALTAALVLTGCTAPRPEVTFYGGRTAVNVEPSGWCTVDTNALTVVCPPNPDAANEGHLTLGVDQPIQINVDSGISDQPWVVVFEYKDAKGVAQNGRTPVLSDGELSYTLPGLGAGTQLTRVEVQSGLIPTQDATGATGITVSRAWAVVISPKAASTS